MLPMSERVVRWYLVFASTACFLFALQFAANSAPLIATDEAPHLSYAASLADGRLPTVETPMPVEPGTVPGEYQRTHVPSDAAHATIWVANHPPGFYLLAVPVIWLSDATGQTDGGLLLLRMLNAAFHASLVAFAGLLARELLPRHPWAAIGAASVQLAMSTLTFDAGAVYNDGLAASLGAWALFLAIRCLKQGLAPRRVVGMAALCAGAALTRSPGIVVTALCIAAVAVAALVHQPRGQRIWPAAMGIALVGGLPALLAGWFFVRNWYLYGGPTASQYLVDRFSRRQRTEFLDLGFVTRYLGAQWPRLFVQRRVTGGMLTWMDIIEVVGAVVVFGLLIALMSVVVRRLRAGVWTADRSGLIGLVAAWLLVIAYMIITTIAVIQFLLAGAGSHERYFLPVAPIISVIATAGLFGTIALIRNNLNFQRILAGLILIFFTGWAVLIQFPTAQWSAARKDNARFGGSLGGTFLPIAFQVLGTAAALVSVVIGIRALRKVRDVDSVSEAQEPLEQGSVSEVGPILAEVPAGSPST